MKNILESFTNMPCIKCCFAPDCSVWSRARQRERESVSVCVCVCVCEREREEERERGRGKMSLPVVNWAYRFLMCQAVASQMRDGTFLRCIFLCFLFKANEVGLPVATWARHSDTRDTLTSHSQSLSHHPQQPPPPRHHHHHCNHPPPSALSRAQRRTHTHAMTQAVCENTHAHTHTHTQGWTISWTFVINSHSGLMFTADSLSKPQTCLFLLSQNSKHPLSKDFFFFVSRLSFFFLHAFRSPTNELNTEEKRGSD